MKTSLILGGILPLVAASSHAATPPAYDFTIGASVVPGLQNPQAVAVDSSRNIYVADTGNQRIVKFSRTGSFLLEWGGTGDASGKFSNPSSIAADSTGNVYVVDSANQSIQKFSSSGAYLTRWYCPHPTAVAIDHNDYVYVADRGVESLVFNHWGGGWVVEYVPGVRSFTSDGRLTGWQWPINTTPFIQYTGLGFSGTYYTAGLTVGTNGDIFVGYSYLYTSPFEGSVANWAGAGIEWLASDGVYALDLGAPAAPDALEVDSANNLYATDRLNNRIDMFTFGADGSFTEWGIPGSGASSLSGPRGVAVDRSDNVYVVDSGHNRILVFAHQPTLNIRSAEANSLILSWSADATGYRLQSTLNLTPPVTWLDVTNPPTVNGGRFTVTNTASGRAQFFRLRKP